MRTFHSEQLRHDQVDIALSISVLCVEITKPEPTMSLSRVMLFANCSKRRKFKNINFKIYDLTLTYSLSLADKTSAMVVLVMW